MFFQVFHFFLYCNRHVCCVSANFRFINFGDLHERENEVINISIFIHLTQGLLGIAYFSLSFHMYNIDGFDFAQTWQGNSEKRNEQFECSIMKIRRNNLRAL